MKFELPELPYAYDALAPHIGAQTVEIHYTKHHQGYLDKVRRALDGTSLAQKPLEDIVCVADGDLYNNAAQVWNHSFYWNGMRPDGGGAPGKSVAERIDRDFDGVDNFKRQFAAAASGEFGSGWAWLVENEDGLLRVLSTTDAENPMRAGYRPLLTLDVWEHAYYLDYHNDRHSYITAFLDRLIDWDFIAENMSRAHPPQQARTA